MLWYVMLNNLRHVKEKLTTLTNKQLVLCFIGNTLEKNCNNFAMLINFIQTNACLSLII